MLETTYSIDAIFALRKTPILISLLFLILLGCMQMTPFAFLLISDDSYRWDERIWSLSETDQTKLVSSLPEECRIQDYNMTCSNMTEISLSNGVKVIFNGDAEELKELIKKFLV